MTKTTKTTQTRELLLRPGEQDYLPVTRKTLPNPSGGGSVVLSFDLKRAPVPQRRYSSDWASVIAEGDTVRLCLGQKRPFGSELSSLVVLNMTPEGVGRFLDSCEPSFRASLREFVETNAASERPLEKASSTPDQCVVLPCNLIATAFAEREACLDCYHTSPFALRELMSQPDRTELVIDAIVRIDMPTALLFSLVEGLFELRKSMEPEVS